MEVKLCRDWSPLRIDSISIRFEWNRAQEAASSAFQLPRLISFKNWFNLIRFGWNRAQEAARSVLQLPRLVSSRNQLSFNSTWMEPSSRSFQFSWAAAEIDFFSRFIDTKGPSEGIPSFPYGAPSFLGWKPNLPNFKYFVNCWIQLGGGRGILRVLWGWACFSM